MKIQLPSKRLLSKGLARTACQAAENLTKSQICDCIEVLAGVNLSSQERRQNKTALIQVLFAAATAEKSRIGRPTGFSPINGEGGAMTKKNKAWSMPDEDWQWLESQPNQSEALRKAIELIRQQRQN